MGGETKIKAKLSPAEAGAWAELGNYKLILFTIISAQCDLSHLFIVSF